MRIQLVVSGGQSGADLAGNAFAREMGIATAIFSFLTFKPVQEKDLFLYESFPRFPVAFDGHYVSLLVRRTEFNVRIAEATVIFVDGDLDLSRGSKLTYELCKKHEKPFKVIFLADEENHVNILRSWLMKHKPAILNVAGSRTCDTRKVKEILKKAYKGVQ